MHPINQRLLTLLVASLCFLYSWGQDNDTLRQQTLRDIQVRGQRVRSRLTAPVAGVTVMDMGLMNDLPHILGNADPMHYAQLMPGIQTASEYDAGLYIEGCDNQHNHVGIEGVTLYNVNHLLGFFSIFNPTHFQGMRMSRTTTSHNRLGGEVGMLVADTIATECHGSLSVGPMSSQGTLVVPTGRKAALTLSARAAYLNLLYGRWLRVEDEQMRYGFDDYNLTWQWQPDERNRLWIDAYYGHDNVGYDDSHYTMSTQLRWHNAMGALHWDYATPTHALRQTLYVTHYANRFRLDEDNLHVSLPSGITDVGYRLQYERGRFSTGLDAIWHDVQPQDPHVEGFFQVDNQPQPHQRATETSLTAAYSLPLLPRLTADASLRATLYHHRQDGTFYAVDPAMTLSYDLPQAGTLRLQAAGRHQYLFRTGFSNTGLPTEFWFPASRRFRPQSATNISMTYEQMLWDKAVRVELGVYYKWLRHQQEYSGNIYDFLYSAYDLGNMLLEGRGRNYGTTLMVEKRKGRLTGWMSYAFGRAMRQFDNPQYHGRWYPANHERPHELNAVATYRLSPRWSLGATYVLASGTPYTAPKQFYLIAGNVITEFYERNAWRVPPYMRLDVAVNYDFRTRAGRRSGLNLSVYNVTAHNNILFYRMKIYDNQLYSGTFSFILPLMPSLNYYYQF